MTRRERETPSTRPADRQSVVELMDDETVTTLRAMSGAERLAIAFSISESARASLIVDLRSEHPSWDEEAIEREAARRVLEGDLPLIWYTDWRRSVPR